MTMYSRLLAVLCLSMTFLSQSPASAQSNPIGVLFTVTGNNTLPVEHADIRMTDAGGVVMQLRTDGYGNTAETLAAAISNPYRVFVTKRAWSLTSNRWMTDTTTYQTVLSPDSAASGGLQRLAASLTRTPGSDPKRVSILFVHYSNGDIALQGTCWNSAYNRNIMYYLDTMKVLVGSDTGKIAFRSYQMNADAGNLGGAALSTATPSSGENGCAFGRFSNSSFGWGSDFNRMSIWCHMNDGPNGSEYDVAGLLNRFFFRPNKEDSAFWAPFRTFRLPDNTLEVDGFDLVCIKQPQRSYGRMNVAKRDSIKVLYSIVYDSMAAHTETNWCLVFGFPYAYDAYKNDAASAALVGQLLHWFNDTLPDPNVHNVWTFDSFTPVSTSGYTLDLQYTNPEDRDHLHFTTGGTAVQQALIPKLRNIAEEILASRRTSPTPPAANPPVANFSGNPTSGTAPLSVTFTDQSTNNPTTWDWNWGDGTAHGTTRNPSHTYASAGAYTVTLTVSNADGSDSEVKNAYITVTPPQQNPPVADFSGTPTSGTAPLSVTFTDQSTNNPTTWDWNWGDGTAHSTTRNPSHTYASAGAYTVTLTVSNADGSDSEVKNAYIAVSAPQQNPPVAAFYGTPTTVDSGAAVSFFDQSTNSPTSWTWNFGDNSPTSTSQNPIHQYNRVGTFSVTLTATNAFGSDDTVRTGYITVRGTNPGQSAHVVLGGGTNDALDTYITRVQPNTNHALSASLVVYNRSIGEYRLLIRWPQLDTYIAGATIDSARLWFYPSTVERGPDTLLAIHRILQDWQAPQATWNSSSTGIPWTTPGMGSGTDFFATATDTASRIVYRTPFFFDVTEDLRAYAGGAHTNFGWMIKGAGNAYTIFVLYSANQTWDLTLRPRLEIWYRNSITAVAALDREPQHVVDNSPCGTPTPASISSLTAVTGFLFKDVQLPPPALRFDFDCDGSINVGDLSLIVNQLFRRSAHPDEDLVQRP